MKPMTTVTMMKTKPLTPTMKRGLVDMLDGATSPEYGVEGGGGYNVTMGLWNRGLIKDAPGRKGYVLTDQGRQVAENLKFHNGVSNGKN